MIDRSSEKQYNTIYMIYHICCELKCSVKQSVYTHASKLMDGQVRKEESILRGEDLNLQTRIPAINWYGSQMHWSETVLF